MFIPLPFFWNSSRISLPHRLDDTTVNSDSFTAEITNRLKETVDFFLWFSIQAFWLYESEYLLLTALDLLAEKVTQCES